MRRIGTMNHLWTSAVDLCSNFDAVDSQLRVCSHLSMEQVQAYERKKKTQKRKKKNNNVFGSGREEG